MLVAEPDIGHDPIVSQLHRRLEKKQGLAPFAPRAAPAAVCFRRFFFLGPLSLAGGRTPLQKRMKNETSTTRILGQRVKHLTCVSLFGGLLKAQSSHLSFSEMVGVSP